MFPEWTLKSLMAATCLSPPPAGLGEGTLSQCHLIQLSANIGGHAILSFRKLISVTLKSNFGVFLAPSLNGRKNLTLQVVGSVLNSCLNLVMVCLKSLVFVSASSFCISSCSTRTSVLIGLLFAWLKTVLLFCSFKIVQPFS